MILYKRSLTAVLGLILATFVCTAALADDADKKDIGGFSESILGIVAQPISNDRLDRLGLSWGVVAARVYAGSPAEEADVRPDDILINAGGEAIYSPERLEWLLRRPDRPASLTAEVYRDGQSLAKEIRLGKVRTKFDKELEALASLKNLIISAPPRSYLGLGFYPMTPGLRLVFGIAPEIGIFVSDVAPDSPAEKAGIKPGDVITRIGEENVANLSDMFRILSPLHSGTQIEIEYIRLKSTQRVPLTTGNLPNQGVHQGLPLPLFFPWGWPTGEI